MRDHHPTILEAVGARLRAARLAAGFGSFRDLAQVLGAGPTYVAGWEAGHRAPPFDSLRRLPPLLGVTLDWLVCGDDAGLTADKRAALRAAAHPSAAA